MHDSQQFKQKHALIVSPHADDLEISMGATVAKMAQNGWIIHEIILSSGEKENDIEYGKIRLNNAYESGEILSISTIEYAHIPDCKFMLFEEKIFESINSLITKYPISVCFIPWKNDNDIDHMICSSVALRALRSIPNIMYFQSLNSLSFLPNYFTDLRFDDYKKKIESLTVFKTQIEKGTISVENIVIRDKNTALNFRHHLLIDAIRLKLCLSDNTKLISEGFIIEKVSSAFELP